MDQKVFCQPDFFLQDEIFHGNPLVLFETFRQIIGIHPKLSGNIPDTELFMQMRKDIIFALADQGIFPHFNFSLPVILQFSYHVCIMQFTVADQPFKVLFLLLLFNLADIIVAECAGDFRYYAAADSGTAGEGDGHDPEIFLAAQLVGSKRIRIWETFSRPQLFQLLLLPVFDAIQFTKLFIER